MQIQSKEDDHQETIDKMRRLHESTLEKATAKLTKSLRHREVEYSQLESMHLAVKAELEQRGNELEVKLAKTKEKLKQAEHRRALEAEGFTNDVSLLRKQLGAVDRKLHQMRLQSRLEDDERLHSMLQKLEKKGTKYADQVCGVVVPHLHHSRSVHPGTSANTCATYQQSCYHAESDASEYTP